MRTWEWSALALAVTTACLTQHETPEDTGPAADAKPPAVTAGDSAEPTPNQGPPPPKAAICGSYQRQRHAREQHDREPNADPPITVPGSMQPALVAGPILGAISDDSVRVWVRTDRDASFSVRVWPLDGGNAPADVEGPPLMAETDHTGTVRVRGLHPAHRYGYAVLLRPAGASADSAREAASGEFHTLAAQHEPARMRVVVGADITGSGPQPIFHQIQESAPDFVLFIGDQMYADEVVPTTEGFSSLYQRNWNIRYLRDLLQRVPAFMIWDDHEIQDNYWMGKSDRYQPARTAYDRYVQGHNPSPFREGSLYYTFRSGDVAFFVLDVRSTRSPNTDPDDANKSMLGAAQKRDLLAWLDCEPATLKVIVSPVIWNDWSMTGKDAWVSFATEREELLGHIAREGAGDVLLLSGDQHWSAVFRFERNGYRFYEFLPTPLSKSRGVVPTDKTPEILARDDDNFVFGVVDIDTTVEPYTVDLTLCAADKPCQPGMEKEPGTEMDPDGVEENVPFTIHLSARDLGQRKK